MNFILISPQFPATYYKFAAALKQNGFTVLGIGDTPFNELALEVKQNLFEYYFCPNMNDYASMFKAVAFFAFKYGKIDYLESHNEWWLINDSKLRTDFNVNSGIQFSEVMKYKAKSIMKQYFAIANLPFARFHLITSRESCLAFIQEVGYPVFVKPNIGVGSNYSYKINDEMELDHFLSLKRDEQYIMEEFIEGITVSYDGIANSSSEVVYESSNIFPMPNYLVVNNHGDDFYFTTPFIPEDLSAAGKRIIKAFDVKNRIFHLEFFRLSKDYPHLGKTGSLVALEVNMRPAGGYTPEMLSASTGISLYKAWADVIAYNEVRETAIAPKSYVAAPARRKDSIYKHTHEAILETFKNHIFKHGVYPPIISDGMGDYFYMAKFLTKQEVDDFFEFVLGKI